MKLFISCLCSFAYFHLKRNHDIILDMSNVDSAKNFNTNHKNQVPNKIEKPPKVGYLYCLFNEMFKYYGDDIYKLGGTYDMKKRKTSYISGYLEKPIIKHESKKVVDWELAEKILFIRLNDKRCRSRREFFKCELETIITNIDEVVQEVNTLDYSVLFSKYFLPKTTKIISLPINKGDLILAKDISEEKYLSLMSDTEKYNRATKAMIQRYKFKKDWKQNELTNEFIDQYFGKTEVLLNLRYLFDKDHVKGPISAALKQIADLILKIISKLGFDLNNMKKIIDRKSFGDNLAGIINEKEFFEIKELGQKQFGIRTDWTDSIKCFLGFINAILKNWNLNIKSIKKSYKLKKKVKKNIFYSLRYLTDLNHYI